MRTILAAVDQSQHAHAVMGRAAELSSLLRADLVLLTVLDQDPMRTQSIDEAHNRIAIFQRELIFKHFPRNQISLESSNSKLGTYRYAPAGIKVNPVVSQGNPVDRICSLSEDLKADLVIVGNRGLGGVGGLVLGSVSERVVHKCSRSVMVVKRTASNNANWESLLDQQQGRAELSH